MPNLLADDVLCAKGLAVLEEQLGPVQARRFLALISRQPFDYPSWRQHHFEGMSLDEILAKVQALPQDQGRHKGPDQMFLRQEEHAEVECYFLVKHA